MASHIISGEWPLESQRASRYPELEDEDISESFLERLEVEGEFKNPAKVDVLIGKGDDIRKSAVNVSIVGRM